MGTQTDRVLYLQILGLTNMGCNHTAPEATTRWWGHRAASQSAEQKNSFQSSGLDTLFELFQRDKLLRDEMKRPDLSFHFVFNKEDVFSSPCLRAREKGGHTQIRNETDFLTGTTATVSRFELILLLRCLLPDPVPPQHEDHDEHAHIDCRGRRVAYWVAWRIDCGPDTVENRLVMSHDDSKTFQPTMRRTKRK